MGLLDGILGSGGQSQQGPGLGGTVAAGVALALLVKGVRQYQASHGQAPAGDARSFDPRAQQPAQPGGGGPGGALGGMLGGMGGGGLAGMLGGGGGLGGMLGSLGGAGALGSLISHFQQNGAGEQAASWVGNGPNQPIAPHEVESALGEDAVNQLQQQSGLPRQQLLEHLSQEIPQAISEATPNGVLPQDDEELHQIARQPSAQA